jgi:hypothetical protein
MSFRLGLLFMFLHISLLFAEEEETASRITTMVTSPDHDLFGDNDGQAENATGESGTTSSNSTRQTTEGATEASSWRNLASVNI